MEMLSISQYAAAPSADALLAAPLAALIARAGALRDAGHGVRQSYSRKVFIPLTQLCRDSCHYCTFAHPPRRAERAFLTPDQVLDIARAGAAAGCHEALFTLGDKPELRYRVARAELAELGHASTISYLAEMCERVLAETGLLPHVNAGVMSGDELALLRRVSVSQGLMLESVSDRLCQRGAPHFGSPDKQPAVRLRTIAEAGERAVPFTSGILIGIGETRAERIEALLALRDLHLRHGHIQEIIVQNFKPKPGTRMAGHPEPSAEELVWTIAVARIVFGPAMNIQAPPNLAPCEHRQLILAGINDWGGVSPVTIDHVNPEAAWPEIAELRARTAEAGYELVERLALYPSYVLGQKDWVDPALTAAVYRSSDSEGFARMDAWSPGKSLAPALQANVARTPDRRIVDLVDAARCGERLDVDGVTHLFGARGVDFEHVCEAADALRQMVSGGDVTYVVNRNINYTNLCTHGCAFCAFSKGRRSAALRGPAYRIDADEVAERAREAWRRGATEVCMQGGIHPDYSGETYLELTRAVRAAVPDIHIHAFSPLEVMHGAQTLGLPVVHYLRQLKEAGLDTLPGTAAEILDDEIRKIICPDKLSTSAWIDVMRTAHRIGLRSTATIMFGHVDGPINWARHLLRIRDLQMETGGFTEFVPLPFVHMEAPIYLRGRARQGPTAREAVLMHAVSRLVLHGAIENIQASWVKMGSEGALLCINAGVNDLGGTLMNESISRAAGAEHGQEFTAAAMEALIRSARRTPRQRTTLYGAPAAGRAIGAADSHPCIQAAE